MTTINIAKGNGFGSEKMDATLKYCKLLMHNFNIEEIEIKEKVYLNGNESGIDTNAWDSFKRTKCY
ncbi:MAG: hypothetical protein H7101_07600 [Deinococcales bacterium]|nr:hypothetical protein [Chitinophagaceae bacterium]